MTDLFLDELVFNDEMKKNWYTSWRRKGLRLECMTDMIRLRFCVKGENKKKQNNKTKIPRSINVSLIIYVAYTIHLLVF